MANRYAKPTLSSARQEHARSCLHRGGGREEAFGIFTEQYPEAVNTEERDPGKAEQRDRRQHDADDASPAFEVEEADAGDHGRNGKREQEYDQRAAHDGENRYRDRSLIRFGVRADDAGHAAEADHRERREDQPQHAERDVQHAEDPDVSVHELQQLSAYFSSSSRSSSCFRLVAKSSPSTASSSCARQSSSASYRRPTGRSLIGPRGPRSDSLRDGLRLFFGGASGP